MSLRVLLFTFFLIGLINLSETMSIDSDVLSVNGMESEDFDRMSHGAKIVEMRYFVNDADNEPIDPEIEEELFHDVNAEGIGSEGELVES